MPKVKVNDINIYYEIHGEGFPFILIRGLGSNIDWWSPEFLNAMSKNFKTIIFDNRGAGRTDKPDIEYSIKMFVDDTIGLMDSLGIDRAHVLGYSMGGMTAQELVLSHPERAEKLILCATNCGGHRAVSMSPEVAEALMKRGELTPEEVADLTISTLYTEDFIKNNSDVIERAKKAILKIPTPDFSFQRQLGAAMRFNTGRRLKKIDTPTLILQGRKDVLIPPKNAEVLANLIPGSRVAYIDDSGHAMFSQNPKLVVKILLEFLQ